MEHVCLDLEGVLIPEIWAEVAEYTGEEQFKLTTQDLKDYSELMDMRINLVESIGLSFSEIQSLVDKMEPSRSRQTCSIISFSHSMIEVRIIHFLNLNSRIKVYYLTCRYL